jgi:predicted  nucleic acid-binding Zn-ribbon protein
LFSTGASSSLATTSLEIENLRSAHKDLESKLKVVEEKQELDKKKLAEKNSGFIREKTDLVEKWKKDSVTLKNLHTDVQTLRTYMTQAELGWDLLNADVMGKNPEPESMIFSVTLNSALS